MMVGKKMGGIIFGVTKNDATHFWRYPFSTHPKNGGTHSEQVLTTYG